MQEIAKEDQQEKDPSKDDSAPTSYASASGTTTSPTTPGSPKASSSNNQASSATTPSPSSIEVPSNKSPSSPCPSATHYPLPTNVPSSSAPSPSTRTSCVWCAKEVAAKSMRECSKCHETVYCSERCEQTHWPQHWQKCIQLSLANVAICAACEHTLSRCPRCKKVWFCGGCNDEMKQHKC